jgi:hypothetical protein
MKLFSILFGVTALTVAPASIPASHANEDAPPAASGTVDIKGLHDFDFWIGDWKIHHRRLKERLADNHEWIEFDGTSSAKKTMAGWGNMDDNFLDMPEGAYRALTVRAFDARTGQWAIWWLDGRNPAGALDPPVRGRFEHGVGTFYADDTLRGKPIRVRFIWSHITPVSARWEQAFSPDGGKTWETNWIMEMRRA